MAKIRSFSIPMNYYESLRHDWKPFAEYNFIDPNLVKHFVSHMEVFDKAYDGALIIDQATIDAHLQNLIEPFPSELRQKVEKKYFELLWMHAPKIEKLIKPGKTVNGHEITRKVEAQVYIYKFSKGYVKQWTKKEHIAAHKDKGYENFLKLSDGRIKINIPELLAVIDLLADFPLAKQQAEDDLNRLNKK